MEPHSGVWFGWDPFWVSTIILIITYAVIISERVNRAIVALLGATAMILVGAINQEQAVDGVDFNTLALLVGMMILVAIAKRSGMFQYLAVWAARVSRGQPWALLALLSVVTAVVSSLLDNVTTVLLIAPVTLVITDQLKVPPYPFLFTEILASNIGGTATLIGDPPNIIIGSAANLSFNDFVIHLRADHCRHSDPADADQSHRLGPADAGRSGGAGPRHGVQRQRGDLRLDAAL